MIARRKDARRRRGWLRVPPSCIERACIIFQKGAREKYPRYSGFACRPPEAPSIGNKYPDFPYHRHQHTYCSSSSLSLFYDFFLHLSSSRVPSRMPPVFVSRVFFLPPPLPPLSHRPCARVSDMRIFIHSLRGTIFIFPRPRTS